MLRSAINYNSNSMACKMVSINYYCCCYYYFDLKYHMKNSGCLDSINYIDLYFNILIYFNK